MPRPAPILCEINAPRAQRAAFVEITQICARDVGVPLKLRSSSLRSAEHEPVLTLHLSAELAIAQHPVWCLACRLACFCPGLRVSVLVQSEAAFAQAQTQARSARSA